MDSSCVVIFSGGQDSTTALFWAKQKFARVYALSFDYGQRHAIELKCAQSICTRYAIEHEVLPIDTFHHLADNALINHQIPVDSAGPGNLPNTFVPGRNLIFLTFAAAWGWTRGIFDLVTGVCQTDYSGYPDCRQPTMQALETAISLGMDASFRIHAPLMHLTKAQSVLLARDLGALEALTWSHTCYRGQFPPCGECPACVLRARGFAEAGIPDPLLTRAHS